MKELPDRSTVDLSAYPDLVVIYLGMRVNTLAGVKTLLRFIWKVGMALRQKPDGLIHAETFAFSLRQIGLRQYWRDFDSLEQWARSSPHREWWRSFLRDPGGTGFWHELHDARGGTEAMYVNMLAPSGLMNVGEVRPARGSLFSARQRLRRGGEPASQPALAEEKLYVGH